MPNWDDQGKQYAAFIEAELKAENDRRTSVNTRAATALTGATGLVTLVLAVIAVFAGKDFILPGPAKISLAVAVLALLAAAVCAVIAGFPIRAKVTSRKQLQEFLKEPRWKDEEVDARNWTAQANLDVIKAVRYGTELKFRWLMVAGALQVLAVLGLVICTLLVVRAGPPPAKPPPPPVVVNVLPPAVTVLPPAVTVLPPCCPMSCAPSSMPPTTPKTHWPDP